MARQSGTLLLGAAALAASVAAGAQTAASDPPRQAAAPTVQAAPYNSAFEGYRAFSADEVGDWRKANDTVREIGGWRAYAREIQDGLQARPPGQGTGPAAVPLSAPAAPAPARPAAPAHHQGHAR
ncbi:MAG: hypothetical protein ACO1PB_21150 [Ramlibacter sp.]